MTALRTQPGSSTPAQWRAIHVLRRKRGIDDAEFRALLFRHFSAESTKDLSSAQASQLIAHLGGGDLPHPPGEKPRAYTRKRAADFQSARTPGGDSRTVRIISPDQAQQIERLGLDYFDGDDQAFRAWLAKNFKECTGGDPRKLLTAQRAGQVIAVLKQMLSRKGRGEPPHGSL